MRFERKLLRRSAAFCRRKMKQSTHPKELSKNIIKMTVQDTFGGNANCSICKLSEIDCLNYGEIHGNKELTVHLFCLYFSTHLPQRGQDNAGIVGFELRDIRKLVKNCVRSKCYYCNEGSATTYCHYPDCGRVFHQVCGFKANARFEYLENFKSFCDAHNQIENENIEYPTGVIGCFICYEALGDHHPVTTVPSCCGKWLHQQCLRKYAVNAGYAFMCPICRNKNYGDFARRHGIYVPEYEALWEKTHNFDDIERFYTHCDAAKCICPDGRTYTNQKWSLQLCSCCGSYGFHRLCRPASEREDIILCDVCLNVEQRSQTNEQQVVDHHAVPASDQNLQPNEQSLNDHRETNDDDVVMIDLIEDATEILEQNIAVKAKVPETLDEKCKREKAERPIRNEMTNYRISLWFRDYELYTQETVE